MGAQEQESEGEERRRQEVETREEKEDDDDDDDDDYNECEEGMRKKGERRAKFVSCSSRTPTQTLRQSIAAHVPACVASTDTETPGQRVLLLQLRRLILI